MDFFLLLLRILFPLHPVMQAWEGTRVYIRWMLEWMQGVGDLEHDPQSLAELDSYIAYGEDAVRLLIEVRAREILRLPLNVFRIPHIVAPRRRARSAEQVISRLERLVACYQNVERLAQRRAAAMQQEHARNPLGLADDIAIVMFIAPPFVARTISNPTLIRTHALHIRAPP